MIEGVDFENLECQENWLGMSRDLIKNFENQIEIIDQMFD